MNMNKFVNIVAYVAVILVSLCVTANFIFTRYVAINSNVTEVISAVASNLTILATVLCAFAYAYSKRNNAFMFVLVVFVILLVLFMYIL